MKRYLTSLLAREHLVVFAGVVLWLGAAVWQLWTFGNRPEIWVAAILMGLGAGTIGYFLAVVNEIDTNLQAKDKANLRRRVRYQEKKDETSD